MLSMLLIPYFHKLLWRVALKAYPIRHLDASSQVLYIAHLQIPPNTPQELACGKLQRYSEDANNFEFGTVSVCGYVRSRQ